MLIVIETHREQLDFLQIGIGKNLCPLEWGGGQ